MIIFKTVNTINGMFYIGQHNRDDDNYLGSGKDIEKALKKDGRKNFTREILEVCSIKDVNVREQYWIKETRAVELGYNKTPYARGGRPGQLTIPEAIKKGVETRKRNNNYIPWNKGKTGIYTEETLEKMRKSHTDKPLSEEHKQKMRGKTPWNKGKTGVYSENTLQKMRGKTPWNKGKIG